VGKAKEMNGRFDSSFYAMGRIVVSLNDEKTIYMQQGTGQSGEFTSKFYYDAGIKHKNGIYNKLPKNY